MNPNPAAGAAGPSLFARLARRALGDWPWFGRVAPLSRAEFAALFRAWPSFADYLPFAGYDPENEVFLLDDGVSVGAAFRLAPADLDARAPARLACPSGKPA